MIAAQFIGIAVVALFLFIGLLLYIFYQRPDIMGAVHIPSEKGVAIYPHFLVNEMPTGIAGIAIVGFFAIAQGSLDSAMNALAASIVSDIYTPSANATHAPLLLLLLILILKLTPHPSPLHPVTAATPSRLQTHRRRRRHRHDPPRPGLLRRLQPRRFHHPHLRPRTS